MAKMGIRSQKNFIRTAYQDRKKARPETIEYGKVAEKYYARRGCKNRMQSVDCESKMLGRLVHDVVGGLFRWHDPSKELDVRLDVLNNFHKVMETYGNWYIVYTEKGCPPPRAKKMPNSEHLYLTRCECGMMFEDFLRCLLGEDIADNCEKNTALHDYTLIPEREIERTYKKSIRLFFYYEVLENNDAEKDGWSPSYYGNRHSCDININIGAINIRR